MVKIEVWSDLNCPFCYIGKKHLEDALKLFPGKFHVEWKSFELDPHSVPEKGISQTDLLAKKYGKDRSWALQMNKNLTEMAIAAGLEFKMDHLIPANSFNAHRLLHLAKSFGKQNQMKEALLKARFTDGLDIGNFEVLTNAGLDLGIEVAEIKDVLNSERFTLDVRADEQIARELGIRGVPFFVVNKKFTLSGAQPIAAFIEILNKV